MIESDWKRIAGIHGSADGDISLVWLALEPDRDLLHLYDACVFKREVFAVVVEGINARGRWIPIAWEAGSRDLADKLMERHCKVLVDPVKETPGMAEVTSREIWERMRTGRFKVDRRLEEWLKQLKDFRSIDGKVPQGTTSPMMDATRYAVAQLSWAKRQAPRGRQPLRHPPKMAIV